MNPIRVILIGPKQDEVYCFFKKSSRAVSERNVNPGYATIEYDEKTLEFWATNGEEYERDMLFSKAAVFIMVMDFNDIKTHFEKLKKSIIHFNYGKNFYLAALNGSKITRMMDNNVLLVDSVFSSIDAILKDITSKFQMKKKTGRFDSLIERRYYIIGTTIITSSALKVWMDHLYKHSNRGFVNLVSVSSDLEYVTKIIQVLQNFENCITNNNVALILNFLDNSPMENASLVHNLEITKMAPLRSLYSILNACWMFIDYASHEKLIVSKNGFYYLGNDGLEIVFKNGTINIGHKYYDKLPAILYKIIANLKFRNCDIYCNYCKCSTTSKHICSSSINNFGYPIIDSVKFIQSNNIANFEWGDIEHIVLIKPRNKVITFDALINIHNRIGDYGRDVHLGFILGNKLTLLERNLILTDKYDAWV